jgi:hypothetical protein
MSDEQTIYISPDDDLTTVRERLEQIAAKRLTMVIPPQTQLRSHVAWKLLYARAKELGKEVTIVSSDPQVRSVAHAVKFKVAHSLEASPATGTRPTSRLGHTNNSGGVKTRISSSLSSRPSSAKTPNESHSTSNRRGAPNTRHPRTRPIEPKWHGASQRPQQIDFEDVETLSEETKSGKMPHALASDSSEKQDDFRIHPTPAIYPLSDQIEEPDLLLEDYTHAQDIRSAAREGQKRSSETDIASYTESAEALASSSTTSQPDRTDDLLTTMEDSQVPQTEQNSQITPYIEDEADWISSQTPQTEQNSVVPLEGIDTNEHIIQDIEEIEDQPDRIIDTTNKSVSDRDESVPPPNTKPNTYTESEQATDNEYQENPPQQSYGVRSRRKSSNLPPTPSTPSVPPALQLDEDALPPIEERQVPSRSSALQQSRMSNTHSSKKLSLDPTTSPKSRPSAGRGPLTPIKAIPQPTPQRLGSRATRRQIRQQVTHDKIHQKAFMGIVIGIILLLFATFLLVYYGPTANILVGITTRDYSQQVTLTAKVGNQAPNLQVQRFSKDFLKSGIGTATGSQEVGTNPAQGTVSFTYDGPNPDGIIVPDDSIITTSGDNPIEFATTAEVLVPPSNQNKVSPPVNIQAVKPGTDGNVDANTITVIPNNTLNSIAQANPSISVSNLKLSVVNEAPTTGGGAKTTPAVTSQDLTNVQNNLLQQLQGEINAWQQQLSSTGAVGTPQITNTLTNGPKVNDIEANGTFPATIKVTATVLLVRIADLQKATLKQLNATITNDKSYAGEAILTDINPTITINQLKPITADANSITFTFNARVQTSPRVITKEYVQQLVMGKSVSDARATLIKTPKVKTVDITVSPSFMPWVTHWDGHIYVIIHPAVGTEPQKTGGI